MHWHLFLTHMGLRQNGRHYPDSNFKYIFLNENAKIYIKASLKYVPTGPVNNIPALVQIMGWHRPWDKPLLEPMMARIPTHIFFTRTHWGDFFNFKPPWGLFRCYWGDNTISQCQDNNPGRYCSPELTTDSWYNQNKIELCSTWCSSKCSYFDNNSQ